MAPIVLKVESEFIIMAYKGFHTLSPPFAPPSPDTTILSQVPDTLETLAFVNP